VHIQVQNLALRAHLPGALATAHGVILKPSAQSQGQTPTASLSKTLKAHQLTDSSTEIGPADVTRLASGPQIITPGEITCSNTEVSRKDDLKVCSRFKAMSQSNTR